MEKKVARIIGRILGYSAERNSNRNKYIMGAAKIPAELRVKKKPKSDTFEK